MSEIGSRANEAAAARRKLYRGAGVTGLLVALTATTAWAQCSECGGSAKARSKYAQRGSANTQHYNNDPGFSHAGFSIAAGDPCFQNQGYTECGRGLRPYDWDNGFVPSLREVSRGAAIHVIGLSDPRGNPIAGAQVTVRRADRNGVVSRASSDEFGLSFFAIEKTGLTHRVQIEAPGFAPAELVMSGGRLDIDAHRLRLEPVAASQTVEVRRQVYVPAERSGPPEAAARAYRRGREAAEKGRWLEASKRFRKAFDLWPVSGGMVDLADGSNELYVPARRLGEAYRQLGQTAAARALLERAAKEAEVLVGPDARLAKARAALARIASGEVGETDRIVLAGLVAVPVTGR